MLVKIIDFHQDDFYDWVADLACGHTQHVRHKPPFINRPWVIDPNKREKKIGYELNCLQCDLAKNMVARIKPNRADD